MTEAAQPAGSASPDGSEESLREATQRVLEEFDVGRTGQLPREQLRRAFLQVLRPVVRPDGATELDLEQFVDRALDRFRVHDSRSVNYRPLVEWLLGRGKLMLDATLAKARALAEERSSPPSSCTSCSDEEGWSFAGWLYGKAAPVVANALRAPLKECREMEFTFAQALGFMEREHPGQGKQIVLDLLHDGNCLDNLAAGIVDLAMKLTETEAATASELNQKFASTEGAFELSFGAADDFFSGLEDLVGSPNPNVRTAMVSEHCNQHDSRREWTTENYQITTTAETEWHFVVDPEQWQPSNGIWPAETRNTDNPRQTKPLSQFEAVFEAINQKLEQRLSTEEWIGARLYTGPMFEKYNAVNRGGAKNASARERQNEESRRRFAALCGDNRYCTTIHAINSALIKLSKLETAGIVYRGTSRGVLPPCFLRSNRAGVRGGVEFGFLSTSKRRDVAMGYATAGVASTLLEIGTGMIDRGANLAPISQYPHEEEICFPPLACMEVVRSRVEGSVLVVEIRLNVNFSAPTIERVIAKRYGLIESMCDNLRLETRANLSNPLWKNIAKNDESAREKVLELVGDMATADLKSVTAVAKDKPELFNNDVTLLAAMRRALGISDSVKWQASSVLRRAASELHRRAIVGVDVIAHITATADLHQKVECREMDPIELKREQTRDLGLGPGSSTGHILDRLMLVEQDGVIKVARPCKLWPKVQPDCKLATVNGESGEPATLASLLINERTIQVVFRRPLEPEELMASLLQMVKNAEESNTEETALLVGRSLALNHRLSTVNLRNESIGPKACAVLARAMEDNRTVHSLFFAKNCAEVDTALALEKALGVNQTLGTLYIENGSFGEEGGRAIANALKINGTLHTLRIRKTQLGKTGGCFVAKALCTNRSLSVLYIENDDLGPEGASDFGAALRCNRTLVQLHMDNASLGPTGGEVIAGALRRNEKLHTLFVMHNEFGELGGNAFAEMLRANRTLRVLGITNNGLGPDACAAIADSMEHCSLTKLFIGKNRMGTEAGLRLARSLESPSCKLTNLELKNNGLEDKGGVAIARALVKANSTLKSLCVDSNGLGYEFAEAIAEVIQDNREFESLILNDNQIGPRGAEVLARALEGSSTLLRIEVCRNHVGPQGALAFAHALRKNRSLDRLDILDNQLTEEAGKAFADTFPANTTLRRLAISESEVGEQAAKSLQETFRDRQLSLR